VTASAAGSGSRVIDRGRRIPDRCSAVRERGDHGHERLNGGVPARHDLRQVRLDVTGIRQLKARVLQRR
jgi:hypothetical protein